ncbi:MAG: SpoIIE family protein phosphatase [Chloroflexi bacterium]|nr:SpoIIE family protein phosphatase [Chloroflexota bacterium]
MSTLIQNLRQTINRQNTREEPVVQPTPAPLVQPTQVTPLALDLAPNDPLVIYFQNTPGAVEIDKLTFDSPGLRALQAAGVRLAVPLVSHGELIGLINLGPRLSEQDYSSDDRALLNNLATQAAPAVQVAQLVRQQQIELQARERMEQELRVARLIQQTLLPKHVPEIAGWQLAVYYQPARAVGGDFYDFFPLPDGRLVIMVGDVTDKGVPAALVMATTRAILRGTARRGLSPGAALERANNLLCPEIPEKMFVTCLFMILDPQTGKVQFANAGHNLPILRGDSGVTEPRATGMPLGLLPEMGYEENEATLAPGDRLLLYSDGLTEAHNPQHEMFDFPRLRELIGAYRQDVSMIDRLRDALQAFTGADWEQEDDVTLLTIAREIPSSRPLAEFSVPSEAGREIEVMQTVAAAVQDLNLPAARLENLKTAVAEATMNAMEHGNGFRPEVPVYVRAAANQKELVVSITDSGGSPGIPSPETPDLEAKLAGLQSPRGWGLFLIKNMVDDLRMTGDEQHHTIELVMRLEEKNG